MRPDAEQLARIPLFGSLTPVQLTALADLMTVRHEPAGIEIVHEGTPGYAFFVIEEGSAVVTSGSTELCTLGPGDFFGEIALLGSGWRTATVTATSPVRLIVMLGRDFEMLEREWPEVSDMVKAAMAERLTRSAELTRD